MWLCVWRIFKVTAHCWESLSTRLSSYSKPPLALVITLLCRRCRPLYTRRIVATPLSVDVLSPPWPEASLISPRGMWCDLAISAWQHGSDAVKCHFTVAHRGSKLLQGLNPWWWGINGTRVLVKGQTTRLMCPQCLYSCYGRNIFKQCVAVYVIVKILSEWRWHGDNNSLSPQ